MKALRNKNYVIRSKNNFIGAYGSRIIAKS